MNLEHDLHNLKEQLTAEYFSRKDIQGVLGLGEKATRSRIQTWLAEGSLYKSGVGRAANVRYSFQAVLTSHDADKLKAKAHFGTTPFTRKELETVLSLKTSTARKRLKGWLDNPDSNLVKLGSGRNPKIQYQFVS